MPCAIERSVANPTIRARLPARKPMATPEQKTERYCAAVCRQCLRMKKAPQSAAAPREGKGRDYLAARAAGILDIHDELLPGLDGIGRLQFVPTENLIDF